MYSAETLPGMRRGTVGFKILRDGQLLSYSQFLKCVQDNASFREFYTGLLCEVPFDAFRWETRPLSSKTAGDPFEFVLVDSPELERPANRSDFQQHFNGCESEQQVVTFMNLGRNARLVVPCPTGNDAVYSHLASFLRGGPPKQILRLWQETGAAMTLAVQDDPLWLSTAGGGVAWLHVRIDKRPKYYAHKPYKEAPGRPAQKAWLWRK